MFLYQKTGNDKINLKLINQANQVNSVFFYLLCLVILLCVVKTPSKKNDIFINSSWFEMRV